MTKVVSTCNLIMLIQEIECADSRTQSDADLTDKCHRVKSTSNRIVHGTIWKLTGNTEPKISDEHKTEPSAPPAETRIPVRGDGHQPFGLGVVGRKLDGTWQHCNELSAVHTRMAPK